MYKVLIADDEDIICRGLAGMVSKRPKLQVAALAEDGEIALEKAKEIQPDLMLVDINMPFLNGLEFIEKIQEILPDALIIIVTGYDDFAFVQKALRLGVTDYVLKPVMEQPFFAVLDDAVRQLDSMNASRQYISWMEEWVEQNRPQLLEDLINELMRGQISEGEFEKNMGYLKLKVPLPYALTVFHIYSDYEKYDGTGGEELRDDTWYRTCRSLVQMCFEPYSEALCFQTEEGAAAVISEALLPEQWNELEQILRKNAAERLHAKIELVQQEGNSVQELAATFQTVMKIYKERMHYSDTVLQAISMLGARWGDSELSLQSVADALFVSAPYLSRVFHQETGENFAAFLTRKGSMKQNFS